MTTAKDTLVKESFLSLLEDIKAAHHAGTHTLTEDQLRLVLDCKMKLDQNIFLTTHEEDILLDLWARAANLS